VLRVGGVLLVLFGNDRPGGAGVGGWKIRDGAAFLGAACLTTGAALGVEVLGCDDEGNDRPAGAGLGGWKMRVGFCGAVLGAVDLVGVGDLLGNMRPGGAGVGGRKIRDDVDFCPLRDAFAATRAR